MQMISRSKVKLSSHARDYKANYSKNIISVVFFRQMFFFGSIVYSTILNFIVPLNNNTNCKEIAEVILVLIMIYMLLYVQIMIRTLIFSHDQI